MSIIDQTSAEFERQKTLLLRSIERAENLINQMRTISEDETYRIQEFIAYSIPRCNLLFKERQQFRGILKKLSLGETEKKQAMEDVINLKHELEKLDTILGRVQ